MSSTQLTTLCQKRSLSCWFRYIKTTQILSFFFVLRNPYEILHRRIYQDSWKHCTFCVKQWKSSTKLNDFWHKRQMVGSQGHLNESRVYCTKRYRVRTSPSLRHINTKNCSLSTVLTATDQRPQKSLKRSYYSASRWHSGNEARDSEWQWHQLGHMQVSTSLQTDNHASTLLLSFLQAGCPSCRPTNSVKALKASWSTC